MMTASRMCYFSNPIQPIPTYSKLFLMIFAYDVIGSFIIGSGSGGGGSFKLLETNEKMILGGFTNGVATGGAGAGAESEWGLMSRQNLQATMAVSWNGQPHSMLLVHVYEVG